MSHRISTDVTPSSYSVSSNSCYFFPVHEWVEFNKSCNLIGSRSRRIAQLVKHQVVMPEFDSARTNTQGLKMTE